MGNLRFKLVKQPNHKARGNGDGTIFKRSGSEHWIAQITLSSNGGKLIRDSKNAKTKNQANETSKQLQEQYKSKILTSVQILEQYLESWIDKVLSNKNMKRSTIENFSFVLRACIIPRLESKKLTQLKTQDAEALGFNRSNVALMVEKGFSWGY